MKPSVALRIFNNQQNNFLKSIKYYDVDLVDKEDFIDYLNDMSVLFINISSVKAFVDVLVKKVDMFEGEWRLCFEAIFLRLKYFGGNFKESFYTLSKNISFEFLIGYFGSKGGNFSVLDRILFDTAMNVYDMEGYELSLVKYLLLSDLYEEGLIAVRTLFSLGERNEVITKKMKMEFYFFEFQFSMKSLSIDLIDLYLDGLYEKDYLERMQVSYVRSKIIPMEKSRVEKLVVINPYTRGLKDLMLAFVEDEISRSKILYVKAIKDLEHIKYYHVEAIFLYSKFLYENSQDEFDEFYSNGIALSKKHCYRFLQYCFEQLVNPTEQPYDPKNYPLPDDLDFSDYYATLRNKDA